MGYWKTRPSSTGCPRSRSLSRSGGARKLIPQGEAKSATAANNITRVGATHPRPRGYAHTALRAASTQAEYLRTAKPWCCAPAVQSTKPKYGLRPAYSAKHPPSLREVNSRCPLYGVAEPSVRPPFGAFSGRAPFISEDY